MNAVESPEGQELQKMGSGAWDNPAYSGPPSPHGTLRVCTISRAVPPQPQPKKPEDGPREKAYRTLVSSCCFQICRGIRGTWWEEGSPGILELGKESQKLLGGRCDLKKRWDLSLFGLYELSVRAEGPRTQTPV